MITRSERDSIGNLGESSGFSQTLPFKFSNDETKSSNVSWQTSIVLASLQLPASTSASSSCCRMLLSFQIGTSSTVHDLQEAVLPKDMVKKKKQKFPPDSVEMLQSAFCVSSSQELPVRGCLHAATLESALCTPS
ncbi:uncharacterized protein [Physcomitrium patens]|uniref:uncharacterized protein n=1 Tax=Physcomitrium patens TaxID=3218 RepID=UPI003CCD303D